MSGEQDHHYTRDGTSSKDRSTQQELFIAYLDGNSTFPQINTGISIFLAAKLLKIGWNKDTIMSLYTLNINAEQIKKSGNGLNNLHQQYGVAKIYNKYNSTIRTSGREEDASLVLNELLERSKSQAFQIIAAVLERLFPDYYDNNDKIALLLEMHPNYIDILVSKYAPEHIQQASDLLHSLVNNFRNVRGSHSHMNYMQIASQSTETTYKVKAARLHELLRKMIHEGLIKSGKSNQFSQDLATDIINS